MAANLQDHETLMRLALDEAQVAAQKEEVPVGALIVNDAGDIIAAAHNLTISLNDPSAHAEMLAIRRAAQSLANYRLLNTTLYTTIEPCIMCMGAIVHARINRVVYGTEDPKWGGAGSLFDFSGDARLNHQVEIIPHICRDLCRNIIQQFFQKRRKQVASNGSFPYNR